jgi:hypothetical protein
MMRDEGYGIFIAVVEEHVQPKKREERKDFALEMLAHYPDFTF